MRNLHILTLAALGLSLSGCGGGTVNKGLETVHQPVLARTDYVYDIDSNAGAQGAQRLAAWFESLAVGYGDRVSVDDPSGTAANRQLVEAAANRLGLMVEDTAPVTQGTIVPGGFRVIVSRTKATVPGCPDWSRKSLGNYQGEAPSNFGCATNANLAAMVADPNDLVGDTNAKTPNDNSRGTSAIRRLKYATPTQK